VTTYNVEDDRWLAFGLAFVGGYSDAVSFILALTFTGHVTGNLIMVAISIATLHFRSALHQVAAIVSFLLGVYLSALIARTWRDRTAWRILAAEMVIEILLMGSATWALATHLTIRMSIFLVCTAFALGLQNGAFRYARGTSVHTTYLTGMITTLVVTALATTPTTGVREQPNPPGEVAMLSGIWMAFVLGAGMGAAIVGLTSKSGMLPAALVLALLLMRGMMRQRASTG
jgi:uncharacterized membrane protein YoaK (UPF0700 family)